jgi:transposase InsO family protein
MGPTWWTAEGWLYLAILLDLASRRVVGWALAPRLDRHLVLTALGQALARRRSLVLPRFRGHPG